MPLLRSASPWLCGGAALLLADLTLALDGVNGADESWTLQIVHRLSNGDALYSDVEFGTTPLSIYLVWGVVALVGQQILTVKALSALLAAGSGLLVARISLQAGATRYAAVLCAALTVPLGARFLSSLYTPLAMLLLLACESVVLSGYGRTRAGAAAAGALAGLSFASKQNVGGLALIAVLVSVVAVYPSRLGLRRAATVAVAFAALAVATVGAMVASGGVSNALDALGLGKGAYIELGTVPYHDTLWHDVRSLVQPGAWTDVATGRDRDLVLSSPPIILPAFAALALLAAWISPFRRAWRPPGDRRFLVVAVFGAAAFLAAFPRYDAIHLAWVAGPLLAACAVSLSRMAWLGSGTGTYALGLAVAAWLGFALLGPIDHFASGDRTQVGLPHFRGAWLAPDDRERAVDAVRRMRAALPGGAVFLVLDTASFYYLAAGLRNPTPYDYPAATTIGRKTTDEILDGVADGAIPAVCLPQSPPVASELRPSTLERLLRGAMRPGPAVGACRLWFPARRRLAMEG